MVQKEKSFKETICILCQQNTLTQYKNENPLVWIKVI